MIYQQKLVQHILRKTIKFQVWLEKTKEKALKTLKDLGLTVTVETKELLKKQMEQY